MRPLQAKMLLWWRAQWPAARLLMATIAIPLTATILWYSREPLLGWCRLRLIAYHLNRGDRPSAIEHVNALIALSPPTVARAVRNACQWPMAYRRWLAEAMLPMLEDRAPPRTSARTPTDFAQRLAWVLQLDPDQREALVFSSTYDYRRGHYRRAAASLQRAVSLAPGAAEGSYWEYYTLGQLLLNLDRYAEAEKCFAQAAAMIPRLPEPLYGLIDSLERQGKYREAIATVSRLLMLDRTADPEARMHTLFRRGRLLGWLGRKDLARLDIEAAMAFWPGKRDAPEALLRKAKALALSDLAAEAMPLIDKLIAADPACADYHLLRAQACQDAGLSQQAAAAYRQALAYGAHAPTVLNNLAWTLLTADNPAQRDPPAALALARRAVALDGGKNAYSLDTLAEACYQNRLFAEAVRYETQALERGGETYRASLARYQQAAEDARASREVKIEVSCLKEHHKPPRGDGGTTFDPSAIPAPPRIHWLGYQQEAQSHDSVDEMFAAMARAWNALPPPAVDDARKDLQAMLEVLAGAALFAQGGLCSQDRLFLAGMRAALQTLMRRRASSSASLANSPPSASFPFLPGAAWPPASADGESSLASNEREAGEFILGERAADWLWGLSSAEAAALLRHAADKTWLLSELFIADYYQEAMLPANKQTPALTSAEAERLWPLALKRLRAVITGEKIAAPSTRWQPPRRLRTPSSASPGNSVPAAPPTDDGEESDLTPTPGDIE